MLPTLAELRRFNPNHGYILDRYREILLIPNTFSHDAIRPFSSDPNNATTRSHITRPRLSMYRSGQWVMETSVPSSNPLSTTRDARPWPLACQLRRPPVGRVGHRSVRRHEPAHRLRSC